MRRTRAHRLALVNWRGVFYERYALDEHVTALEGENGAGKTTVMIGAYVVLLPDMSLLRFANVGEHGATGGDKGLYGRLGNPDRPTYSIIDFRLANGERFLAGVHLERRAEPSVELTPFFITGLGDAIQLQNVLLERGEVDSVPNLDGLATLVAAAGGHLQIPDSTKAYFAELFERGVTPLRLAADDERKNFNDMLRTSMVGGISRTLAGGFRDFLLREETTLADNLKRMRTNLDSCRRTRIEVAEAERIESEIHGVYEAGERMFAAAVHATRERADELYGRFRDAHARYLDAAAVYEELCRELAREQGKQTSLIGQLSAVEEDFVAAKAHAEQTRLANDIDRRLLERRGQRESAQKSLEDAQGHLEQAKRQQHEAKRRYDSATDDQSSAAAALAKQEAGFAELQRRAATYALLRKHIDELQDVLGTQSPESALVAAKRHALETTAAAHDKDIAEKTRLLATAEQHRRDFDMTLAALCKVAREEVPPREAYGRAQSALNAVRDKRFLVESIPDLSNSVETLKTNVRLQQRLRATASSLLEGASPSAADVAAAFASEDERFERLQSETNSAREQARRHRDGSEAIRSTLAHLEALEDRWALVQATARQLEREWGTTIRSSADVDTFSRGIRLKRDQLRERLVAQQAEVDRLGEQIGALESGRRGHANELLDVQAEVEGQLLTDRFDDVSIDDAPRVEALLGPLRAAIVVDHPTVAVGRLLDNPPSVEVRLVALEHALALQQGLPGRLGHQCAVVDEGRAVRVTPFPESSLVGRRARELRIEQLRSRLELARAANDGTASTLRSVDSTEQPVRILIEEGSLLGRADPAEEVAKLKGELARTQQAALAEDAKAATMGELSDASRKRRQALGGLLGDAHWLDRPDQASELETVSERLALARREMEWLRTIQQPLQVLESRSQVLRMLPLDEVAVGETRRVKEELEAKRDATAIKLSAIGYVETNLHSLEWRDAASALRAQLGISELLKVELQRANELVAAASAALDEAREGWDEATKTVNKAQAAVDGLDEKIRLDEEDRQKIEVVDASDAAVRASAEAQRVAAAKSAALKAAVESAAKVVAKLEERISGAKKNVDDKKALAAVDEAQWKPAQEQWERLQSLAKEHNLLGSITSSKYAAEYATGRGSANLRSQAQSERRVVIERLANSRDATSIREELDRLGQDGEQPAGEGFLRAWLSVRDWLRRRVPPQISEGDDPLEALSRLRDHLIRLATKLRQQEDALRGQSTDIARNIEIQGRRAKQLVRRLNEDLRAVSFGSIRGVKIDLQPAKKMTGILDALKGEDAQQLLFKEDNPIEDAMEELFRRQTGGKTSGERLLDYREYFDLTIQVLRQASETWEPANAHQMSTGEAIGVGAAVMMVVLAAWEREANLLRGRRTQGTMRLLFLDEANRLDRKNLGILFELCRTLELQLIIAAPEVARAEGNTTYRLVRVVVDGREEVRVTGRRVPAMAAT